MKPILSYIILLCFLTISIKGQAQELSNLRLKKYPVEDTVRLDTLSVIPGTVVVFDYLNGREADASDFLLNYQRSLLIWRSKPLADSVEVAFRVFPYDLGKTFRNKSRAQYIRKDNDTLDPFLYYMKPIKADEIDFGTVNYDGTLARGISFGNTQNIVVNSSLNLQLTGQLTDDIEIMAAITDENIPIQPEGNTRQVQEFDKVFIQLKKDRNTLIMGDIQMRRPDSYFMNFFRKSKGGQLFTDISLNDAANIRSGITLAVAKGKFTRNTFLGQEGNQGPYRLHGDNGEAFIIVLAGTERVFIDGKQMTRGEENDYVIDYNLGEVTFTPNQLITGNKRIIVEFEYSDQNYFRSQVFLNNEISRKDLKLKFNLFSEQDHKNQPLQADLDQRRRSVMKSVGDSIQKAFLFSYDSVGYDSEKVLYQLIDTLGYDSVFLYSADPARAVYKVNFSFVGKGNGDYLLDTKSAVNGRVYKWVAPVNGVQQGFYAPVINLVTPKISQMLTVGAEYKLSEKSGLKAEVALSKNDMNMFSAFDDQDDRGLAAKLIYNTAQHIGKSEKKWILKEFVDYELVTKTFSRLQWYRSPEFNRDWNIENATVNLQEHIGGAGLSLERGANTRLGYRFNTFIRGQQYTGLKHHFQSHVEQNTYRVILNGSYLSTDGTVNSRFFRPNGEISKMFPIFKEIRAGVKGEIESNKIFSQVPDSLRGESFEYRQWGVFAASNDSLQNNYSLEFNTRADLLPFNGRLSEITKANTFSYFSNLISNPKNQLRWKLSYRTLKISDTSKTDISPDNSMVGRVEYNFTFLKGALRSNTLYELGRGLEQKREFIYIRVPDGEGIYTWNDYNENGVKELNEFEQVLNPSFRDQAKYIRVLTPTNEFQKTFSLQFNESLNFDLRALWYTKKGLRKLLSRFSTLSALQFGRKTLSGSAIAFFNPLYKDFPDSILVSLNSSTRNVLYFNRTGAGFGMDLNMRRIEQRMVLVNGFEDRGIKEYGSNLRWNINRFLTLRVEYKQGIKLNDSELFSNKDYHIRLKEMAPALSFLKDASYLITVNYRFSLQENTQLYFDLPDLGGEKSILHEISLEGRYSVAGKNTFNSSFSFIEVDYNGKANSPVAYVMLEGLQKGRNMLWNIAWNRQLGKNMQIDLLYDGRKSEKSRMVHIGRAQVRYIF